MVLEYGMLWNTGTASCLVYQLGQLLDMDVFKRNNLHDIQLAQTITSTSVDGD
jgi:hypothetical protein